MRLRLLSPIALLFTLSACDEPSGPGRDPAEAVAVAGDAQTGRVGLELPAPLVVRVLDASGRPVPNSPVTFVVTAGGGTLRDATDRTDGDGEARAAWILGLVAGDTQRVEARAAGAGGDPGVVARFTAVATAGAATSLQRVTGQGAQVAAYTRLADSIAVRAVDGHGNPVAGVAVAWTTPAGTVSPGTSTTGADGIARTSFAAGAPGSATVTAAAAGLAPVAFSLTVASRAVYLRMLSPTPGSVVGDSLAISVRVDSARASVASVVAAAAGRSTVLSPAGGGTLGGHLSLAGTPLGELDLVLTSTTVDGDTSVTTVRIIHDEPPVVGVLLPSSGTVARPEVRIQATCADDDPAGCAELTVVAFPNGAPQVVLATGTSSIDRSVSLAAYEGRAVTLEFRGLDSRGTRTMAVRSVYVESSSALTEAASAGARLLDLSGSQVLYRDTANLLHLRSGSGDVLLGPGGADGRSLHPAGTLYVGGELYDWRNGSRIGLGPLNAEYVVAGGWAIWSNGGDLYRRDLVAGTHVRVSTTAINSGNDVAPDGAVVYATGGAGGGGAYDVYRFDGATTCVTADPDAEHWNVRPRTDGTNVVYFKSSQGGSGTLGPGRLALWRNGVETLLTATPRAFIDYDAAGGWIAFTDADGGGILQIHVRAPSGEVRRVTSSGSNARLRALGDDGTVVYAAGGSVYVLPAPHTGAPRRIGNDWEGTHGTYRFVDDVLYLFLGRTAFRVND